MLNGCRCNTKEHRPFGTHEFRITFGYKVCNLKIQPLIDCANARLSNIFGQFSTTGSF